MSPANWLFEQYLRLFFRLRAYANRYVELPVAERCARSVMAGIVCDALYGLTAEFGVHERAYSLLAGAVGLNRPVDESMWSMGMLQDAPLPDAEEVCDLSRAYGIVYMTGHHAGLSIADRAHVVALIQQVSPPDHRAEQLESILTRGGPTLEPLRRAFWECERHVCQGDLICAAADQLRDETEQRGARWVAYMKRGKELT